MRVYMISYDLNSPGKDYGKLIDRLTQLGALRVLKSQWVIKGNTSAELLRDDLKVFIDANDSLLVTGLTGEAAWTSIKISNDQFKKVVAA